MKRILAVCFASVLCFTCAEAGISKIRSVKVVVSASIAGTAYVQETDLKNEVMNDFKSKLPKVKLSDGSDYICEVRYSDDYRLSVNGDSFGSYYVAMLIKSEHKKYDNIAPSSKVYWERGFFMPLISCKTLNASVKSNIVDFINSFAADWNKDQKMSKKQVETEKK